MNTNALPMRSRLLQVLAVLGVLFSMTPLQAQTNSYQDLPDYTKMLTLTNNTGGDAVCFPLADSTGGVVYTEDTACPTNLYCLKVAKGGVDSGRKKILVIGNQHAREWIGYRCVLDCAQFIISNRNISTWSSVDARFTYFRKFKDMNISNLTDNANFYFIPVANPSGYIYSKANDQENGGDGWRKNRRETVGDPIPGSGTGRENSIPGVDINRNWPGSDWGRTNNTFFNGQWVPIVTSRYTNDTDYCGKPIGNSWTNWPCLPICEKEVQGIVALMDANAFDLVIDVHSFGRTVGWNDNVDTTSVHIRPNQGWKSDKEIFQLLAAKAASLVKDPDNGNPYVPINSYPVSGDVLWYAYEKYGSGALTFLFEVGPQDNFRPSNATAHSDAVMPGLLFMMFASVDERFDTKPTFRFRKP